MRRYLRMRPGSTPAVPGHEVGGALDGAGEKRRVDIRG
ncbi:hypothetical protein J2853_009308 [Streptosporangium lutulentum]|uniref:Uncharacterized protein n=1 Tax=Streptosporangium lutulentum TaxID=1461250 RepID=A0ABT9QTK2_9ACTN|nr:hypothetical protein [Streptosporangium lutulentum]